MGNLSKGGDQVWERDTYDDIAKKEAEDVYKGDAHDSDRSA